MQEDLGGDPVENQPEQHNSLHIRFGGESDRPTDPKAQRLKSWANIIATTAALIAGVAGILKPQDQTAGRQSYNELKSAIEQSSKDDRQNHDDIVALRNFLDGYLNATGKTVALPTSSPPPPPPAGSPSPSPSPSPTATAKPKRWTFNGDAGASSMAYAPAAPAPALPDLHTPPPIQQLPNYDQVVK